MKKDTYQTELYVGHIKSKDGTVIAYDLAKSIPNAERQIFEGQSHVADPKAVARMLEKFFKK